MVWSNMPEAMDLTDDYSSHTEIEECLDAIESDIYEENDTDIIEEMEKWLNETEEMENWMEEQQYFIENYGLAIT